MLEVVCIESALGESLVGQDVIVIDNDVQGVALGCKSVLDLLEDLGMGNCGRAYGDLNGLCCGRSFGFIFNFSFNQIIDGLLVFCDVFFLFCDSTSGEGPHSQDIQLRKVHTFYLRTGAHHLMRLSVLRAIYVPTIWII